MVMVSVVTPAYRAEKTLASTLESLIRQSHGDWEALVVDDGSPDATAAIAERFAREDARFRLLRRDQSGVFAARNAGIAAARGDWIVFLDSDDALAPDHLEIMLRGAEAVPAADILHCGWRRMKDGRPWWRPHPTSEVEEPFATAARMCPFAIHSALVRRAALLDVGGFDPAMRICEDWDLWQRLARSGARFAPVEGLFAEVRVEPGSLSSNTLKHLEAGLAVIRRGHGRDARVARPVFAHAAGREPEHRPMTLWYLGLWLLGAAIGRGEDPVEVLRRIDEPLPIWADAHSLAAILEDGIVVGAFAEEPVWPGLWPRIEQPLAAAAAWLDRNAPQDAFGSLLVRALERRAAKELPASMDAAIGGTRVLPVDLAEPVGDLVLPGVERLRCRVRRGDAPLGEAEFLVFGDIEGDDLAARLRTRLGLAPDEGVDAAGQAPAPAEPPPGPAQSRGRKLLRRVARRLGLSARPAPGPVAPPVEPKQPSGRERFESLVGEARRTAEAAAVAAAPSRPPPKKTGPAEGEEPRYDSESYWEGLFSQVDPWDYRNNYETTKYEQTLAMLDGRRFPRALELACAEGTFSRMLSPVVDELVATDISASAVARAASLDREGTPVRYRQLDLLRDDLGGPYDLVVCSEVLYYFEDAETLRKVVDRIAASLRPGGWFVTAHANLLVDRPGETGFGWPHAFGAAGLGEIFAAHPELALSAEAKSPLYRIQRFEKVGTGRALLPAWSGIDTAQPLPLQVATQVRWRGGAELEASAEWHDVPILMYHRVCDDAPAGLARYSQPPAEFERQLAFLRDGGWRGMTLDRLLACFREGARPPPRSVVLSFDDATRDFLTAALPLLHRYGFPASLFVPTDTVGGAADWDAAYGPPAPILGWDELAAVAASDVTLGAHGARPVRLSALSPEALVAELAGPKAALESRLGRPVAAIAYPYGDFDPAIRDVAEACGYGLGLSCVGGLVGERADPLALKRQEVWRGIDLAAFERLLDPARQ